MSGKDMEGKKETARYSMNIVTDLDGYVNASVSKKRCNVQQSSNILLYKCCMV